VWWVDLGKLLGAHQAALSLPLLCWTREQNYNERLVVQDKDREITKQLLSRAKQT